MNDIIQVQQAEIVQAMDKAAIDVQIATAKAYPRNLPAVLNTIQTYATMDEETAEDCFYALRREGRNGQQLIEGLSVRMAEIVASAWGNLRVQTQIIGNDGKTVTVRGTCMDLETNVAVQQDVPRRITDRNGRTFSEDMQVVTINAASAIAFRNAVLKVVPKAVIKKIVNEVKKVAMGQSMSLEERRQNLIGYYAKIGVSEEMLYQYLGITKREEIDMEAVFELKGLANAIKEGSTTVQESFIKPVQEKKEAEAAKAKAAEAKKKAQEAAARSSRATKTKAAKTTEVVDTETGEVKMFNEEETAQQ